MSLAIYVPKDSGDLKLLAEVEDVAGPDLAVDAFLDENPRSRERYFIVIDLEEGFVYSVEVTGDEQVRPKRPMAVSGPSAQAIADRDEEEDEAVEEVRPKRRGRPPGSKNKTGASTGRNKPGPKPGAKLNKDGTPRKKPGPKSGSARTGSKPGPKPGAKTNKDGTPRKKPGPKPKTGRSKRPTPFKRSGSSDE